MMFGLIRSARMQLKKQIYRMRGVKIGAYCYMSPYAYIDTTGKNLVEIGDNCTITRGVMILCHSDAKMGGLRRLWKGKREFGRVKIGDNVFIGVGSVIMPGVTIGDNTLIGSMSLVTKDISPGSVVYGVPAKKVKSLKEFLK